MLLAEILNLAIETLLIPWNFVWENFGGVLTAAWDLICGAVGTYIQYVSDVISAALEVIQGVWDTVWGAVSQPLPACGMHHLRR